MRRRRKCQASVLLTDQERDAETGLDYFGARYYDPWVGRFMSVDPESLGGVTFGRSLADTQQTNVYSYVRNSPTRLIDPTGRIPITPPPDDVEVITITGTRTGPQPSGLEGLPTDVGAVLNAAHAAHTSALASVHGSALRGALARLRAAAGSTGPGPILPEAVFPPEVAKRLKDGIATSALAIILEELAKKMPEGDAKKSVEATVGVLRILTGAQVASAGARITITGFAMFSTGTPASVVGGSALSLVGGATTMAGIVESIAGAEVLMEAVTGQPSQ